MGYSKEIYSKNTFGHVINENGATLEEYLVFGDAWSRWNERGFFVDHKNGNPLDCRRSNLVIVDLEGIKARDNNDQNALKNRLEFKSIEELQAYIDNL